MIWYVEQPKDSTAVVANSGQMEMGNFSGIVNALIAVLSIGAVLAILAFGNRKSGNSKKNVLGAIAVLCAFPTTIYFGLILWQSPSSRTELVLLIPWIVSVVIIVVMGRITKSTG